MRADDPNTKNIDGTYRGPFWFTIGGGIETGESLEQAAIRETFEETGISSDKLDLGKLVWIEQQDLIFKNTPTRMINHYFLASTAVKEISMQHLTDYEKTVINELKWFAPSDIADWHEPIYPSNLYQYLIQLLEGEIPDSPIHIPVPKDQIV